MIRLIYAIPSWILFQAFVFIPLMLLGWVMIPIAAACRAYKKTDDNLSKPNDGPIYHFTWGVMFPWDNFEDGIANRNYKKFDSMFMQIIYWSAIRNPVNNLRIVPVLSCKIRPERVQFRGSFVSSDFRTDHEARRVWFETEVRKYDTKIPQWFFCWHGFYSNFYWQFMLNGKLRRLWCGWKIMPTDVFGLGNSHRRHGAGFALQWKVVK